MCQRRKIKKKKKAKQTPSGFIFFSILQVKGREIQGKEKNISQNTGMPQGFM